MYREIKFRMQTCIDESKTKYETTKLTPCMVYHYCHLYFYLNNNKKQHV